MRYRDVVNFEPIESVVQLRQADEAEKATELVRSYVISDRMAEQIAEIIIPQLQFERPTDNGGLLILGNYGTGKSHLMSLLSSVAERPELVDSVNHSRVREAMAPVAGKFNVKRVELGAVEGRLRDKLLGALEEAFADWGTPLAFPDASKITNNKDPIIAAMGAFHEKYPEKGVLLVVDELLDFLRSQNEQALIRDLAFLREIGEVTALTNFRFMAGLQEMLFDNPRFSFVAEQLNRVRDRFEQVSIVREDIAFVVSNRLLKKSDEQMARISDHLQPFTPLYHNMSERIDEHVRLFPIHPAYLDTFQNVRIAEKREVLKTFSSAIRDLFDKEVPADEPGTISYDHYYDLLQANKSLRSIPEVADVMDKSKILFERVTTAYQKTALKPMASRIIKGLAVHRLTTDQITDPIGATPDELRDTLGLYARTPEVSAEFLGGQVRVALNDVMKTVNGQYISHNPINDQYYLDVEKDIDFESHLKERADALSPDEINRAYFNVLVQLLDYDPTRSYVHSFRIWLDEIPWEEKRVTRPGYFFFGEPSDRSTAEPARDFYVYFLPEFTGTKDISETAEDEVVFSLTNVDATFHGLVRDYAAAAMEAVGSAAHRDTYRNIADQRLRNLRRWIDELLLDHVVVTYQGVTQPASKALGSARNTSTMSLADVIKRIAGAKLAPYFAERYPDYPSFEGLTSPVTETSRTPTATEAIRMIATGTASRQAKAVLRGLGVYDLDDRIRPASSRFAVGYLQALKDKPSGHVLNRSELIESIAVDIPQPLEKDRIFRLEPEWVAVVLCSLVHSGDITLSLGKNETIDASTIDRLTMVPIERLSHFQHFGRPKEMPIENWKAIFEEFGLAPGLITDPNSREQAIRELQAKVQSIQIQVAETSGRLNQRLTLWVSPVFNDNFQMVGEKGAITRTDLPESPLLTTDLLADIRGYKQFLEELVKFNTPGKLQNLKLTSGDIAVAHT